MKYYLFAFFFVFSLLGCTEKKQSVQLPPEIANQRCYKVLQFDGDYKIPDNMAYHAIVTSENEIKIYTRESFDINFQDLRVACPGSRIHTLFMLKLGWIFQA